MPQGTWLGPYEFLSLMNDLESVLELHKYVDDCTLSEIILKLSTSVMQGEIDQINSWSNTNLMNINTKKTKEMLLGPIQKTQPPSLQLNGQPIERVHTFKLLGVHVSDTLTWNYHISAVCSKAAKRLHFLKLLKRTAMSTDDLLYYYTTVIRPVTEYACVVWHTSLTKGQTLQLESIQKRALKIIFGNNTSDLSSALNSLPSLSERRDVLTKHFFTSLLNPSSCLHDLIPEKRDNNVVDKLRDAKQYLVPFARTESYKNSTVIFALNNYQ
jgi:hypothetical protein